MNFGRKCYFIYQFGIVLPKEYRFRIKMAHFLPIWNCFAKRIPISHQTALYLPIWNCFIRLINWLDKLSQNKKEIGYERFQLKRKVVHNLFF
jgi:hypothetical protein